MYIRDVTMVLFLGVYLKMHGRRGLGFTAYSTSFYAICDYQQSVWCITVMHLDIEQLLSVDDCVCSVDLKI